MNQLTIRPARKEDLLPVSALWQKLTTFHQKLGLAFEINEDSSLKWVESFERTLGRFCFLWVAEEDGRIGAFLLARIKRVPSYLGGALIGEISDLFVCDEFRGRKIGTRLVDLALEEFASQNVHSIEVQVMFENLDGLKFWQSQGFKTELTLVRRKMG